MNVRKIMARLNPRSPSLQGSAGGKGDLTDQDIAAALGFCPPGLGREVFCYLWWPLGASLRPEHLHREIALVQHHELCRLRNRLAAADLDLALAQLQANLTVVQHDAADQAVRRALAARDAAREQCWPFDAVVYGRIRAAVLAEMAESRLCPKCRGDGCLECDGIGVLAASNLARAHAIGRDEAAYRKRWGRVYDFTLRQLHAAEHGAARALRQALRAEWEDAA